MEVTPELLVIREAAIRGQGEEVRLDALQVAILLERLAEGCEDLVQRVGRNGANRTAEHICLD